jgi:transposase
MGRLLGHQPENMPWTTQHASFVCAFEASMNLGHVLRDIHTDGDNLHGDASCPWGCPINSTTPAHRDAVGSGAVHPIKTAFWGEAALDVMDQLVLSDAQWGRLCGLIIGRPDQRGSTGRDNRMFVEGVLWIVRTDSLWHDLPEAFGRGRSEKNPNTIANKLRGSAKWRQRNPLRPRVWTQMHQ